MPAVTHEGCFLFLAAIGSIAATGCGSKTYPVEGKVVFSDGKAAAELAGGSVVFESHATRISAAGEIRPDGGFRLTTEKKDDGAPPGKYKVIVTPPDPDTAQDDRPQGRRKPLLDPKFHSFEKSGIEVTVEPRRNQINVTVERAKP
jgi:hypothetical protein